MQSLFAANERRGDGGRNADCKVVYMGDALPCAPALNGRHGGNHCCLPITVMMFL
jgi:hypothetical protein